MQDRTERWAPERQVEGCQACGIGGLASSWGPSSLPAPGAVLLHQRRAVVAAHATKQLQQKLDASGSHPSGQKVSGPAPTPIYHEPAWAAVVHPVQPSQFVNVANVFQNADSLWRDGAVAEDNYTVWSNLYVWTGQSGGQACIGTYVPDAVNPTDAQLYDVEYPCPRPASHLYITSIAGQLVTFRSATGVSGTFDLGTHTWSFSTTAQ